MLAEVPGYVPFPVLLTTNGLRMANSEESRTGYLMCII